MAQRDGAGLCSTGSSHEGDVVGIIEAVAVIVGLGSLVYLAYALLKPDRI